MKARLVQMGNSRGVRLPKPLIEEVGLGEVVDLRVSNGAIVIAPERKVRQGWAEAAQKLHEDGGDRVVEGSPSRFDREEWEW